MRDATITEARRDLSKLLAAVAEGERITITRRGVPVAELVPLRRSARTPEEIAAAIDEFRELRRGVTLGNITIRELIDEGRR